jgi:ferredoxin
MRVVVDFQLCEGSALCMSEAPEVFDVDDDANLRVLTVHPPEAARNRVEAAARACPKQAIAIKD